eukprot:CAMPEP_0203635944 /NCGR_PEP_ID=MMETSP0088-20131115/2605_1 /ASSEMBLY_ACC=CAM_ASM_001087 /TAXON_ID=426623 /ORGANISM="Chaetoceros affinis, Strain CCMP159" /LENGTH=146 /DNA_ID=CAMNT_0050489955 /DNA_START=168 /DNA_END=608 /DNA_ORIENTATION=-
MTILSKESKETHKKENYNERMSKTGRPVSPHVTIYSFPITALTSITNRATGVALSVGALGVASLELLNGSGATMALMQDINASSGAVVTGAAKFTVAFPLVYHYLGGVRHLAWDNFPDMLTNVDVVKASYALVGGSVLLSAGLACV